MKLETMKKLNEYFGTRIPVVDVPEVQRGFAFVFDEYESKEDFIKSYSEEVYLDCLYYGTVYEIEGKLYFFNEVNYDSTTELPCYDRDIINEWDYKVLKELKLEMDKEKELFGIKEGIICQQCNCVGSYGAGISGAISKEFPVVEKDFREQFKENEGSQFGTYRLIKLTKNLYVANIYSQDKCGYPINGIKFTDIDKLVSCIEDIALKNPDKNIYLPHSSDRENDGIGCGLGGEKWSNVEKSVRNLKLDNIYALNTIEGVIKDKLDYKADTKEKKNTEIER